MVPLISLDPQHMLISWIHQSGDIRDDILVPLAVSVSLVWLSWSVVEISEGSSISGVYAGMDWQTCAAPNLGCQDGWRFHLMTSWCWCNFWIIFDYGPRTPIQTFWMSHRSALTQLQPTFIVLKPPRFFNPSLGIFQKCKVSKEKLANLWQETEIMNNKILSVF